MTRRTPNISDHELSTSQIDCRQRQQDQFYQHHSGRGARFLHVLIKMISGR